MLSSKRRAEREDGWDWCVGVEAPLVETGVDVPFEITWSEGWKLMSVEFVEEIHSSEFEICRVDEDVWTYPFRSESANSVR